ncbi:MAG: hypothetical protein A2V21_310125 [Deltaproteobacteria bacterium GWC2_55_46]|nr:MAG: hypothetical protein A2Z79_04220 [Deltaproteobacteria bacterium GWA2_55_82]OGQ64132.1 MAG: hypothetical protein A3I81_10600 [Deltaproteobacteria bacterium RIFCSPLOWO2_02_FULL_55_12]OIJ74584.1 MAG: hypothetical protein A2V21_310125 [Deltaproteobacteria bacterium GWC2_55_46]
MNWQSIKTRLMGSYTVLLALFLLQMPVVYWVVSGMGQKYSQVDEAGSLRKKAVEITELLSRHVATGNAALEKAFHERKAEFGDTIGALRNGGEAVPALKGQDLVEKLDSLEMRWTEMSVSLDRAMEYGRTVRESKSKIKDSTSRMVEEMGRVSPAGNAGVLRLGYLFELYLSSQMEKESIYIDMKKEAAALDAALKNRPLDSQWQEHKGVLLAGVASEDKYNGELMLIHERHMPDVVAAGNALTKLIAERARSTAMKGLAALALPAVALGGLTVFFMLLARYHILDPIMEIKRSVEDFSRGALDSRSNVKVSFLGREMNDEIASLSVSVNRMSERVSGVIEKISATSVDLAAASEELSATSGRISEGARMQSGQTTHAATAMEEMSATVLEVARNSQQASIDARKTREIAAKGGQVVHEAIAAMKDVAEATSVSAGTIKKLGASSEEIGTIVSVINDIADQTNLLALNAAIEAARAGEQGRGFAVVADEVRKLAERTTRATKEISVMIQSIQDETSRAVSAMNEGTGKVENGLKLANEAGQALKDIVSGVETVTDMIGQIATSAEEQSATTAEITRSMDSIADVSRTSVTSIGEVEKATGELMVFAAELKELINGFRSAQGDNDKIDAPVRAEARLRLIHTSSRKTKPAYTSKA